MQPLAVPLLKEQTYGKRSQNGYCRSHRDIDSSRFLRLSNFCVAFAGSRDVAKYRRQLQLDKSLGLLVESVHPKERHSVPCTH